jgi:hypothetical protein
VVERENRVIAETRVAKKQLAAKIRRYSYLEMKNAYPAVTVFSANP